MKISKDRKVYSHNGKTGLTTEQFYESVLEHGDPNIQKFYNAMKFYRNRKDFDKIEDVRQRKLELFGVQSKGKKRLDAVYSGTPKIPKTKFDLNLKTENCMTCKFAQRDKRNHEYANRIVCANEKSFKFEMPVDKKQVCKWREAKK